MVLKLKVQMKKMADTKNIIKPFILYHQPKLGDVYLTISFFYSVFGIQSWFFCTMTIAPSIRWSHRVRPNLQQGHSRNSNFISAQQNNLLAKESCVSLATLKLLALWSNANV